MNLNEIANFFEGLLKQAHFVSIALGYIVSTGFTQFAKYPIRYLFFKMGQDPESSVTPKIEVEFHRWTVRAVAVFAGAIATLFTWPDGGFLYKLIWAIATGLACPTLYEVVTRFFPWLGEKATADRVIEPQKP